MKIIVLSDSHGDYITLGKIIKMHPEADRYIFLGDMVSDMENMIAEYNLKNVTIVKGNNDYFSDYPNIETVDVGNSRILAVHGHLHRVYEGTDYLFELARQLGCDIALFGHTHIPCNEYKDGIYVINPGSVRCCRTPGRKKTYGVIDIKGNDKLVNIAKIK